MPIEEGVEYASNGITQKDSEGLRSTQKDSEALWMLKTTLRKFNTRILEIKKN